MRRDPLGERGSSTVELALILPLLLLALVGAVQFAVINHAQNVAATAVEEGARLAASDGATLGDGASRTRDVLRAGLGATGAAFAVDGEDTGETVTLHAIGQYRLMIP